MILELAQAALTVTWGQLGVMAAVFLGVPATFMAVVRFGDRLWRNGSPRNDIKSRITRLEESAIHVKEELGEIKGELVTLNERLFDFLKGR